MVEHGEREQQGLQVEGLAGRVVLGEVHQRVGMPAERRVGVADQRDDACPFREAVVQRRDALARRAGQGGDDGKRRGADERRAGEDEFGGDLAAGADSGAPGQQLLGGLHQDGGSPGAEEGDPVDSLSRAPPRRRGGAPPGPPHRSGCARNAPRRTPACASSPLILSGRYTQIRLASPGRSAYVLDEAGAATRRSGVATYPSRPGVPPSEPPAPGPSA